MAVLVLSFSYVLLANLTLQVRGSPYLSHANFTTLQSTWRVALYKIFRVRDVNNLLAYIYKEHEYFTYQISIRFEKASIFAMSTVHTVFFIVAFKEYELLCQKQALRYKRTFSDTCMFLACV